MQVKTCPATIKAAGAHEGTDEGVFEAIVAAYNVDSVGDRIIPGAFKNTIEQWKSSGDPIPVVWSHKSDDPDYHIGYVEDAEERPEGLWVRARIDIDDPRSKSAKVYKLLKGRRVTQMSFAYDEIDARPIQKSDDGATKELHELRVYEVGPTLIGANQATNLLDVKHDPSSVTVNVHAIPAAEKAAETAAKIEDAAAGLKAGRVLSRKNEDALSSALSKMDAAVADVRSVLAVLEPGGGESDAGSNAEKATPDQPADAPAADSQSAAKSVEPARPGTASARLRTDLELLQLEAETYTI